MGPFDIKFNKKYGIRGNILSKTAISKKTNENDKFGNHNLNDPSLGFESFLLTPTSGNGILSGLSKIQSITTKPVQNVVGNPFDRRLGKIAISKDNKASSVMSFSSINKQTATSGYTASKTFIKNSGDNQIEIKRLEENITEERRKLQKSTLNIGVPALQNNYAIVKLYGSEGGKKLINKRGERRWYEVDQAFGTGVTNLNAFSMNPTTSSLISWGNSDPYNRTPYNFSDFVFSKYWNKIQNNRLITLRRYAAPIIDNLKFPGMDGTSDENTNGGSSKVSFPPMATAITYFGEGTNNSLTSLLKFTTGVNWAEAEANVWDVTAESTPDYQSGPAGLFGAIGQLSKALNMALGNFKPQLVMNKGNLPPDPYHDGPYENRIMGPVNRIDSVKKRKAGLNFEWSGLNLVFEYVARPIGGINPKAVLLDILSNFLVMGSASAVFFGGQHRFMANPAMYPFLGGQKGIESWYNGKPIEYAKAAIKQFTNQASNPNGTIASTAKQGIGFFNTILNGSMPSSEDGVNFIKGLVQNGGLAKNILVGALSKSTGPVPYLRGLKALLSGEPVGDWHITIGNPLNPIAMIGNLICTGIEVEFGEELGPDDFPTEVKITVKLDHGMPRDRDAIESIFNRGMGRIYDLPDDFEGSSDTQTVVDKYTSNPNKTGTPVLSRGWLAGPSTVGSKTGKPMIKNLSNEGVTSVWSNAPFLSVSPNTSLINSKGELLRSQYRNVDWIAIKSLK